jgi:hypothetical protein
MATQPNWYSTLVWRKSRASADVGECVEIARLGETVLIRDSHDRSGTLLRLTSSQWLRLTARIRNGDRDDYS